MKKAICISNGRLYIPSVFVDACLGVCERHFSLLSVNGSKTKVILNKDKPGIPYNNDLLEVTSKKSKKHLRTCPTTEE